MAPAEHDRLPPMRDRRIHAVEPDLEILMIVELLQTMTVRRVGERVVASAVLETGKSVEQEFEFTEEGGVPCGPTRLMHESGVLLAEVSLGFDGSVEPAPEAPAPAQGEAVCSLSAVAWPSPSSPFASR